MNNDLIEQLLKVRCLDCQALPHHGCTGHDGKIMIGFHPSRIAAVMQGEVGGLREAIKLAMQALSAFGDTEEGVTTAYNILKDAVQ